MKTSQSQQGSELQHDTTHAVPLDQAVVRAGGGTRSISNAAKPTAGAGLAVASPEQQEQRDEGAPQAPITLEFCSSPAHEQHAGEARERLTQQLREGGTWGGPCAQCGTVLEPGAALWIPAPLQPTPGRLNLCCCCCH